jgi:thiamine biosynthesis lipoprotein
VTASIQSDDNVAITRSSASPIRLAQAQPRTKSKSGAAAWPKDWVALIVFTAPPRQLVRDQHFRAPYMAMWISDLDNKPIRTLLLVGRDLDWQKDNYIWWSLNEPNVKHFSATRSMSTSGSGVYKMQWDGTDDAYKEVPAGKYILHVETSRERGKHTHRSLTLDFQPDKPFTDRIPTSEEAGGLTIDFHHP